MPRQVAANDAESQAIDQIDAEDTTAIAAIARASGPPPDSQQLSAADEDEAWATADPQVDHETMASQLMTQGLDPQTAASLLVVKLHPEWAPDYAKPTQDAERADQLTKLAQWPFRLSLLPAPSDPEAAIAMVAKAEALNRRYQKNMTQRQEQAAQMARPSPPPEGD